MDCSLGNRKSHPVLLSSRLPSLVAYWGQSSVSVHRHSSRPLRRSSKTNHQWEVKLLQCHSDNPQWSRHTSFAKFCGWILTRTKMFPQLIHWGPSLTPWMNKLNKSYKYYWECVELQSLKEWTEWVLHFFHISRLLAAWLGELSPSKSRLLWEKHWIMHLRREGRLTAGSNTTPSSFTSFPIHWQIDEGF